MQCLSAVAEGAACSCTITVLFFIAKAISMPSVHSATSRQTVCVDSAMSKGSKRALLSMKFVYAMGVLQVHRIQNKKLWKLFAFHHSNMQERWSHEPDLHLANGGLSTLWHGTSFTEPYSVDATEQGELCCCI